MLNLRYIFRLVMAFISRFKVLIGASVVIGILAFFMLKFLLPILDDGSTVKIGLTGRYSTNNLPTNILEMVGDGLTQLDKDGNVKPNLAASWETPDKGKTWIFKLKDNLKWQDGKPVTGSTISYAFSDVTVENPDEHIIVFKLQNPYSAFPVVVSKPTFKKGLLGTGDWEVKRLSLAGTYVDQILLENGNQKVIYKFYPTEENTKLAFKMGEVDRIEGLIDSSPISSWPKVKVEKNINTGEFVGIFFDTQDKLLAGKNIRQALSYAINKDQLGDLRALGPISIDSWAYNPQVKPYTYDLEKAKGMIDDYKKSAKVDNDVTISFAVPPVLLSQGEKIAKDWEAIGVKVNLQVLSSVPNEYQALLAIFDIPDDPDQYSIWHSTQTATNITKYQNPRIDKLLEDGRTLIDLEDRRRVYLDFQRFLVEDSPAAFLYYPTTYTISRR